MTMGMRALFAPMTLVLAAAMCASPDLVQSQSVIAPAPSIIGSRFALKFVARAGNSADRNHLRTIEAFNNPMRTDDDLRSFLGMRGPIPPLKLPLRSWERTDKQETFELAFPNGFTFCNGKVSNLRSVVGSGEAVLTGFQNYLSMMLFLPMQPPRAGIPESAIEMDLDLVAVREDLRREYIQAGKCLDRETVMIDLQWPLLSLPAATPRGAKIRLTLNDPPEHTRSTQPNWITSRTGPSMQTGQYGMLGAVPEVAPMWAARVDELPRPSARAGMTGPQDSALHTAMAGPVSSAASVGQSALVTADTTRLVEFLFATTRVRGPSGPVAEFTGNRAPELTYGIAAVRVPDDHKIGRIELPRVGGVVSLILGDETPDQKKHFRIRQVAVLSLDEWSQVIHAKRAKSALVFVHGYNVTFEQALYRNAQVVWDMQYDGLSVLFSWAAKGGTLDYRYDLDSAYMARPSFISLLRLLREKFGIERVDILAHSMGNVVALDALASHASTANPVTIAEMIMAAPDVDRDQFQILAREVRSIAKGMTLYASSADKALILSRGLASGVPRAGDVPSDGPIVLPWMETIDVTALGDEMLGLNHDVFAATRTLIDDIKILLTTGVRPPSSRLAQIRPYPEGFTQPRYWRFAP